MIEREIMELVEEHHRCNDEFEEAWAADDHEAMQAALDLMRETFKRCHSHLKAERGHGPTLIMHGIRLDCVAARIALLTRRVDKLTEVK